MCLDGHEGWEYSRLIINRTPLQVATSAKNLIVMFDRFDNFLTIKAARLEEVKKYLATAVKISGNYMG